MSQHSYSTSDVEYMQEVEQLTLDAPNEPEAPGDLAPPVESTPPEGSPALVGTRSQPGASIVRPDLIVEDAAKQQLAVAVGDSLQQQVRLCGEGCIAPVREVLEHVLTELCPRRSSSAGWVSERGEERALHR